MIDTKNLREMPGSLNDACRKMELAADCIDILQEALRAFAIHATYPVSTEINPRGYAWRGEEALDYAKSLADSILTTSPVSSKLRNSAGSVDK